MRRGLEFTGFVAVAAAVHAGVWGVSSTGGIVAGGAGGAGQVTLAASGAQVAALVETWRRPVDLLHTAPAPVRPGTAPEPVAMPPLRAAPETPPRRAAAPLPRAAPLPDLPRIDRAVPPAPVPALRQAAPPPEMRPRPRPAPPAMAESPDAPAPKSSRARARETAQGQGGGASGAARMAQETPGLSTAARQSLMAGWGGQIRARIERQKRYPRGTRATGTAHLVLTVSGSGALVSVVLRQSSGDPLLDQAAVEAVRRARLPAKPEALPGDSHRFNLPVAFAR